MSEFGHTDVKIRDLIASIKSGKYQLPCFQRDFKWNPAKIKSLINSVQHEYPAGSLLFLKVKGDTPIIPVQEFKYADKKLFTEKPEYLVLDGQQRMTSCFSVFTNSGYYTYYINYLELMNQQKAGVKDYDFESLIVHKRHNSSPNKELDNGLFPISFISDRETFKIQIKSYVNLIKTDSAKADICDFLLYEFESILNPIFDYEFPVIILPENSTMEAVCKVFQTINTTGLKLSVFDICVAVFMPQGINLKEKVSKSIDSHPYVKQLIEKDATVVLQVVALLSNKAPNSNTLATVLDAVDITENWDDAITGIEKTLMLFDSFGAGTKKNLSLLPYTPMVPIVAATLIRVKYDSMKVPDKASAERKIKTYFYTAALSTRYTEGTNAKINDDYKALKQWILADTVPLMISHGVDWNTEKIIENNKNGAFGKAILCMLNSSKPKDFYYVDKSVGVGEGIESCDLHHIFPKAKYENNYCELIDSVFNYTWLIKETNIYIQDEKTKDYLSKIITDIPIPEDGLKKILFNHQINDAIYQLLKDEKYEDFIIARAEQFKQIFSNSGVKFTEVGQDELEVVLDGEDSEN